MSRWTALIIGTGILLAALVLGLAFAYVLGAWTVDRTDVKFCQLVSAIRVSDTALYHELVIEGATFSC